MAGSAGLPAGVEPEEVAGAQYRSRSRWRRSSRRRRESLQPGEVKIPPPLVSCPRVRHK